MKRTLFSALLACAVDNGVVGAALVDRNGNTVDLAGKISEEETMPLVALVMYRLKSDDLGPRLFAGEMLSLTLDDRDVAVGIAKRQLFVVAVLRASTPAMLDLVRELRDDVAGMLSTNEGEAPPPWAGGRGGSGSGPADLPLIELGISIRRERGTA